MKKATDTENKQKIENLKSLLKEFGISSPEELDAALSKALDNLTLGIMTETITVPAKSA